jgi:hypothetical protein
MGEQVALQPGDDRGELVDQPAAVGDDAARSGRQHKPVQPGPSRLGPQRLGELHAAVGEHGVDAVLEDGAKPDQAGAVAQQGALVTHRLWGDPRLGQGVGAQQVRQGAVIDPVVFEAGRRDRLAAAGVDQVRLQAELLEQVSQPAPAVGGLERHRGAALQLAEDGDQLDRVVGAGCG